MASAWQLKYHARFHGAVLRRLFPPPSAPAEINQEETKAVEEADFQAHAPKMTQIFIEQTHTGYQETNANADLEPVKPVLSRAQRKRLKMSKLKDTQSTALPAKNFIGPLLPDSIEKRKPNDEWILGNVLQQEITPFELEQGFSSARADQPLEEMDKGQVSLMKTEEEQNELRGPEAISLSSETREGRSILLEVEQGSLSKTKRRRLAKKKFHDSSRYSASASSFTVEIKGEDILIKPIV